MVGGYQYYVQSPRDSTASTANYTGAADQASRWSPFSSAPSSPLINLLYQQDHPYHPQLGEPLRPPLTHSRRQPLPPTAPTKAPYNWETVDEESEFPNYKLGDRKITRKLLFFWCRVYLMALLVMLSLAFLILWLVCKPKGSLVEVEKVEFSNVALMHGSDRTLVPTEMLFLRSRVALRFHNPSKYFQMAFEPSALTFSYLGVPLAHGKVFGFLLNQQTTHSLEVHMDTQEAPLYGAGPSFELSQDHLNTQLTVSIEVGVSILWNTLRRKFSGELNCSFVLNTSLLKVHHLYCS
ncbi:hypothetical protein GOP47_0026734 [Adiantum capillus-veneris]|nr:hypothetical protein GOP47_0026734 [Adiantum capillus-veneris]